MKNPFESADTLAKFAQIDECYYRIQLMEQGMLAEQPKTGLDALIDRATGYDVGKLKERTKGTIEIMKEMIALKKEVEADTIEDEKMLNGLIDLLNRGNEAYPEN